MNDVESRQQERNETVMFLKFLGYDVTDDYKIKVSLNDINTYDPKEQNFITTIDIFDFKELGGLFTILDKIKSLSESSEIIIHYCRNYCGIWLKDVTEFSVDYGRNIPVVFESSELVSENNRTFTKHKDTIQEAIYTACLKFVNYYINGR